MNDELTPAAMALKEDVNRIVAKVYPNDFEVDNDEMLRCLTRLQEAIQPWASAPSPEVLGALAILFGGYACGLVMHREREN